jgi:hypothetical protein
MSTTILSILTALAIVFVLGTVILTVPDCLPTSKLLIGVAALALVASLSTAADAQQIIIRLNPFRVYVPPITLAPGFTIPGLAYPPIYAPPEPPNWRPPPHVPPHPPRHPATTTITQKKKAVAPHPKEADTTIPPTETTPQIEQPPPSPKKPPPTSSYFGPQEKKPNRPYQQR